MKNRHWDAKTQRKESPWSASHSRAAEVLQRGDRVTGSFFINRSPGRPGFHFFLMLLMVFWVFWRPGRVVLFRRRRKIFANGRNVILKFDWCFCFLMSMQLFGKCALALLAMDCYGDACVSFFSSHSHWKGCSWGRTRGLQWPDRDFEGQDVHVFRAAIW